MKAKVEFCRRMAAAIRASDSPCALTADVYEACAKQIDAGERDNLPTADDVSVMSRTAAALRALQLPSTLAAERVTLLRPSIIRLGSVNV